MTISRALVFVFNNFGQCVPEIKPTEEDKELLAQVTRELQTYLKHLENIRSAFIIYDTNLIDITL